MVDSKLKRMMVHVYLTDEEKKRIALQAQQIGISVSSYIKIKLFMKNDRE